MHTTMSLTMGNAPFGENPGGRFNAPIQQREALLYFEAVPQRVRAIFAKETVVDSGAAKLLHESGRLPVYYFPHDDVRPEALVPSERTTRCPWKGEASYWSLRVGERDAPDAAWSYREPLESASFLAGHVAFYWDALDEWFAEDEQLFGHPRDPYHRIDVYKSSRHVRVSRGGDVIADTRRAKILFETSLPPRYYMPAEDVRTDLPVPSARRSRCAYKGSASYWSVRVGGRVVEDLVWAYPEPQHDAAPVRDLLCFFNERVDLEVDGELQERPKTQWSRDD
jgi:uncharacterized protein (DUF427 family)